MGVSWDEDNGVPDGFVHLTYRIPDTGQGFSALDRANLTLLPYKSQGITHLENAERRVAITQKLDQLREDINQYLNPTRERGHALAYLTKAEEWLDKALDKKEPA